MQDAIANPAAAKAAAPAADQPMPAVAKPATPPVTSATQTLPAKAVAGFPVQPAKTVALTQQTAPASPPGAVASVGGTLFALALVLGLIFGLAWLARRMPGLSGLRGGNGLRVVAALPLGTRERLVVVEVGDTQLLLGTGAGGTRLLHTLDTPLPAVAPVQTASFAQLLAKQFGKQA